MIAATLVLAGALAALAPPTVDEVIAAQVAAWNRGDLESFCAAYAEDAVFVSPKGVTKGRAGVLARYRSRYPNKAAMGTRKLEIQERSIRGESATLVARWVLTYADAKEASGFTLIVLERTPGGWQITRDASM